MSDRGVSTADLLGLALEPLERGGVCICVHEAVADQMIADGWGDKPLQARIIEHLAWCHAVMNRKVKCPAWDTCLTRIKSEQRMTERDEARWGDTFWPSRLGGGLTDQFRFTHPPTMAERKQPREKPVQDRLF